MKIEETIKELKSRQIQLEWLKKVKCGYRCIGYGNGSGTYGTGANLNNDGTRLLCGKCGKAFSYIDVAAYHYGFDISNFADAVKKICEIENIQINNFFNENSATTDKTEFPQGKKSVDAETLKQKKLRLKLPLSISRQTQRFS